MLRLATRSLAGLLPPLLWLSLTTGCGGKQGDEEALPGSVPEVEDMTSCSVQEDLTLEPFALVGSDQVPQGYFEEGFVRSFFTNADYFMTSLPAGEVEDSYLCPKADLQAWPASPIEDGRCTGTDFESNYAMRLQGVAIEQWASLGTKWYTPGTTSSPIDAREFDGIAFWARRGCAPSQVPDSMISAYCEPVPETAPPTDSDCADDSAVAAADPSDDEVWTGRTIFVSIMEWQTEGWTRGSPPEFVYCNSDAVVDELKCDAFGVGIGIDTEWRYYKIPFSSMRQRGYGMYAECPYLAELWGVNFALGAGDWDLWLDDITFYREGDEPEEREECTNAPPED